jgi:hypothetical protein
MFSKECKLHMEEAGMTRWQHFKFAFGIMIELKKAELAILVHMVVPRCCQTYASDKIKELAERLDK